MKIRLATRSESQSVAVLEATLPASADATAIGYQTVTGALLRINGRIAGAFDREHREVVVEASRLDRELTLEVERRCLPTNGLPSGRGLQWFLLNLDAAERPRMHVEFRSVAEEPPVRADPPADPVPLWGHSHLDVAWLWTYAQARRKALRTFANALGLLDADRSFVFVQSQPQLYAFVSEEDVELFEQVVQHVHEGRFDADVAALWVEPDCNIPSGESLLRQMLEARRFCVGALAIEPSIAWLPDTFGFARTLPTLLAHAGIPFFATTKLQWNDTTRFPYAQFRWRGPDGSEVISLLIDSMDGGCEPSRVRTARERREPLIVGYGDGGGGPTMDQLRAARTVGVWERPHAWFDHVAEHAASLPIHDDELYLEYHRGVYTTHHDVKAQNASLERKLSDAEEQAAWCVAVQVKPMVLAKVRSRLREAWRIVLRNQFHDVLTGTSIAEVYKDVAEEYAQAHKLVDTALASMREALPHPARPKKSDASAPQEADGAFVFDNGLIQAHVLPTGTLVELTAAGCPNSIAQANVLAVYRDRPEKWEAWNIDAAYEKTRRSARPQPARIVDGGLEVPFRIGASRATMRISLAVDEPFLRVQLAVDWRERRRLLRVENWFAVTFDQVVYGAPHGSVTRITRDDSPERRAKYEVPGQRFALARNLRGSGVACLSLDTYGWSGRWLGASEKGGLALGHSLLRGTCWPDSRADVGEHQLTWAYAPVPTPAIGPIEHAWRRFAHEAAVRLFSSDDEAAIVAACKPAEDGDGVVVRVRECDGSARTLELRCGGRMREVECVDALERPVDGEARIEGEAIVASLAPFALRSFRVRF